MNSTSLAYNGYQEEYDFTASPQSKSIAALDPQSRTLGCTIQRPHSKVRCRTLPFPRSAEISQHRGKPFIYPPEAPGDREKNGINDMRFPKRRQMGIMSADSTSEPPSSSISTS